eukprot:g30327.t1
MSTNPAPGGEEVQTHAETGAVPEEDGVLYHLVHDKEREVKDVAMGIHLGPSYAAPFQTYSGHSPQVCLQYMDDIIGAASISHSELENVNGVAMGIHIGPGYAAPFQTYSGHSPQVFLQYMNDIIGAASISHSELEN